MVGYDLVLRRLGPSGTRVRSRRKPEFGCSFWVNFKEHGGSDKTHTHFVGTKCLWSMVHFFLGWFWNQAFWWVFFLGGSPQYRISGSNMLMLFSPKCHEQVSVFSRTQVALPGARWFWLRPMENSRRFQRLETSSVFLFQKKITFESFPWINKIPLQKPAILHFFIDDLAYSKALELPSREPSHPYVPWSKVAILGMVIPPLIGILIIGI